MKKFKDFLLLNRKEKHIRLFFDIETLQYNEKEGRENPSSYKNVTYSVAVGYFDRKILDIVTFPSFKHFFDVILTTYRKWKLLPKIELIAHNTNKYDNHFLRHDLIYFYNLPYDNLYLRNATKDGNVMSVKKTDITKEEKETGLILEKRIKSSNNLELLFYMESIEFYTTDNYIKTNTSIRVLGNKLLDLGIVSKEDLKTDFDYRKYNKDYDMTDNEAYRYAEEVYNNLTNDDMVYIHNDIILLANSVMHYSKLFDGFDYSSITYTSNILKYYNDNDLTSYQLLKSIGKGKEKKHLRYTDYSFTGENFYDYLKSFYRGGLNFYNDEKIGEILEGRMIGMDINSSYPYAMHKYKVPTFLENYAEFDDDTFIKLKKNEHFYLYRMSKYAFDSYILANIESKIIRQMLVKYFTTNDFININSYTIEMIEKIAHLEINELPVLSYVSFSSVHFASRDKISQKYYVKTQGATKNRIDYHSPYNITILDEENETQFTREEIDISKVILNGLYGIPALRSHFNVFRWVHDELINVANGYENNERNIVFSIYVTAVSLLNLLTPFQYLTAKEIDEHFIYCDTDSLYFNYEVFKHFPSDLFHNTHLGKWTLEYNNIKKMTVINHKKYAYETFSEKHKKDVIKVKCGGVPNNAFNTDMTFKEFVTTQFSDGATIKNLKSIYNKQGTISIYDSTTELQTGGGYRIFSHDPRFNEQKRKMFDEILKVTKGNMDDMLYIESELGTFSINELQAYEHEEIGKLPLHYLKNYEQFIIEEHFDELKE